MTVEIPSYLAEYLNLAAIFIAGYHIAYLFKNYSRLFQQLGFFVFLFLFAWMFGLTAVALQLVETAVSWPVTLSYAAGFFLRFFRNDA